MTTEAVPTTARSGAGTGLLARMRSTDQHGRVLALIVLVQVLWLSALMSRGWYYQDDLAFLSQASGRGLGLTYLSERVNDHLTPGLRLAFWLLQPLGASAYGVTIALRVVLQAAATLLLYRLLVRLVGAGRVTLIVLAGYALSPLLIGELWLSCAVNVLPAQVFVLLGMHSAVSFVRSGKLRYATGMGFSFLTAVMFWELTGVDFLLLAPLALGYLYDGTFAQRLAKMRSQWLGWSIPTLMLVGFAIAYLLGGRGTARLINAGKLLRIWWQEWAHTVAPMALGGPWKWIATPNVYVGASKPPTAGIWIAQAVVIAAVAWSVRRSGRGVLVAWSLPVIFVVIASTIVAIGRFKDFGLLPAHIVTYAFDAAIPVALAAALAFGRPPTATARPIARRLPRHSGLAIAVLLVLALVGTLVSGVRFTNRWAQNPTRRYLATLRSDLDARPAANIFDTPVPSSVLPYIEPHHYLSDVVGLIDQHPAFDAGRSDPEIVDGQGHIVPARFYPAAQVDRPHQSFCSNLITGLTTRTEHLSSSPGANEWFVRLDYFQQHPSVVHVTLVDRLGRLTAAVSGARVLLGSQLSSAYLRFPRSAPVALRISSDSLSTNVCFTAAIVGYPFVSEAK